MITPIHRGTAKGGRMFLKNRKQFDDYIASFKPGTALAIIVVEDPLLPTPEQRGYYRAGVLGAISDHTGHTKDWHHTDLLLRILGQVDGDGTSQMTMQEMAEYIEECCRWCWNEFGFIPPAPDQVHIGRHRDFI